MYDSYHWKMLIDISNNSTMQQDVLNASDEVNNVAKIGLSVSNFATFLTCVTGMPGNVFVIGAYACNMTTSTRVYIFALAVADLVVCICGIVLTTV